MDLRQRIYLNYLRFREHVPSVLMVIGMFAGLAGIILWYIHSTEVVARYNVDGVVQSWTRVQSEEGTGGYVVYVTLENGRKVVASMSKHSSLFLKHGMTIELTVLKQKNDSLRYVIRKQ
ncbi:hypothetical protein [Coralliovum pocilloporae]|uniref:hypothetical protein n=1 Tax=Coralliovum pocilloporae TaxID=3066369 RepID=UPI003307AE9E